MRTWTQDFRYALRMLRKAPGLSTVMVLSLAIGIGASSAVFSVVDALLLQPLPYPEPQRLAAIWLHSPGIGIFRDWPSPGQYNDLRKENHSFEEIAISRLTSWTVTSPDRPQQIDGMRTSSDLLRMLGAKPFLGRLLAPEDDRPGKAPVTILSYGAWSRLFNSDAQIVGKGISLNGNAVTVAGVLAPEFRLNTEVMPSEGPMDKIDIFVPLPMGEDFLRRRGDENYNLLARLKPGVSVRQAQADVDIIAARVCQKDKRDRTYGMTVVGLSDQVVGGLRRAILVLLGWVALVLFSGRGTTASIRSCSTNVLRIDCGVIGALVPAAPAHRARIQGLLHPARELRLAAMCCTHPETALDDGGTPCRSRTWPNRPAGSTFGSAVTRIEPAQPPVALGERGLLHGVADRELRFHVMDD